MGTGLAFAIIAMVAAILTPIFALLHSAVALLVGLAALAPQAPAPAALAVCTMIPVDTPRFAFFN